MELLAAPPPELAALADTSARGAAPLLRPEAGGDRAPGTAMPFELLFGLLTEPAPCGKPSPVGGKKLPLAELAAAAERLPPFAALAPNALTLAPLPEPSEAPPAAPGTFAARVSAWPGAGAPWPPALDPRALPPAAPAGLVGAAPAQGFAAELAVPVELVPTGDEAAPLELAERGSPDAFAVAGPASDGLEALFANDARGRAQLGSTATAEPRPSAAAAPPPAANGPLALPEGNAPGARAKAQGPGVLRGVDSLAAITPLSAGSEAATGISSGWLPLSHVHANHTAGTTGAPAPAAPQAPIDTQMPDWHEGFAQRVQWLVDMAAGEARIKLNPPELGAVDVKISLVDDKTHVHLTAATAAARDELAQSLPRLRELLTVSGLELGSASVHDGRGGEHARPGSEHARHGDAAPPDRVVAPLAGLLDEPAVTARTLARGRIDVFA